MAAWGRGQARHLPPPGFFKEEEIIPNINTKH
jgi:hypothetical protein